MEQSNTILEALKNFVDVNKSNIQRVKVDNPALHDVVLDTLIFLNKKFGNEEITKQDLIQEEVVQEVPKEDEITIIQPYQFSVGDILSIASDKDEIPDTLIVVKEINNQNQNIELEFYNLKDTNYSQTPVHVGFYPYSDITNLLNNGTWKIFDLDKIAKVGDTFTNKQNSFLRKINNIVKEDRNIYYSSTNLINNITVDYNTEIIVFLRLIKDGEFKKNTEISSTNVSTPTQTIQTPIKPTTPTTNTQPQTNQIELWDIFIDAGTVGVPKIVNQIINIKTASYTLESTNFELDRIVTSDEFKKDVIEQVNNGNLVKYVPFKVGDVLIDTTYNTTEIIKIERIANDTLYSTRTDEDGNISKAEYGIVGIVNLMYNGYVNFDTSQNVLTVPTVAPQQQTALPYKVGDKFREKSDLNIPPIYIYEITEIDIDTNKIVYKSVSNSNVMVFTDTLPFWDKKFKDLVPYLQPVIVAQPQTPPTLPTPTTAKSYKVGDKFIEFDDKKIPPKNIYTIINIVISQNTIIFDKLKTKTNEIDRMADTISAWENDLTNGILVPYIEPVTVTSTPAPQSTIGSGTKPTKSFVRKSVITAQFYIYNADPNSGVVVFMNVLKKGVAARYYFALPKVINSTNAKIIAEEIAEIPMVEDVDLRLEKFGNSYYETVFLTFNDDFDVIQENIKTIIQTYYPYSSKNITQTAPNPIPTPAPKPASKTPKPPKSNPPVVNLSCREIKNAIKDLTLLIDLGDNSVMQELNEFKQLLKTQNCK